MVFHLPGQILAGAGVGIRSSAAGSTRMNITDDDEDGAASATPTRPAGGAPTATPAPAN